MQDLFHFFTQKMHVRNNGSFAHYFEGDWAFKDSI
jgi:hypothetical protein